MHACRKELSGGRWHFQHGPIDLILQAHGRPCVVAQAHARAWQRFESVLQELVGELPVLRMPIQPHDACTLKGVVARRMWAACAPHSMPFITPMAAVAGSVAQEMVECYALEGIDRAWVNNGGDIALHIAPGFDVSVGLVADVAALRLDPGAMGGASDLVLDGRFRIDSTMPVRGVATSGWRGRSQSLGIADSVTVLARTAAQADAAATLVANAVNVDDARIHRLPACEVRDQSDLGMLAVTVDVPPLPADRVRAALRSGLHRAQQLQAAGQLWFALLSCQGQYLSTTQLQTLPHRPPLEPTLSADRAPHFVAEPATGSVFA